MKSWYVCWYDKHDEQIHVIEPNDELATLCDQKNYEECHRLGTNDITVTRISEHAIGDRLIDAKYAVWALNAEKAIAIYSYAIIQMLRNAERYLALDEPDTEDRAYKVIGYMNMENEFLKAYSSTQNSQSSL